MRDNKAFASLSSGLLARKGQARPAMRPQGFGFGGGPEDLGWNDMGHDVAPRAVAPRLPASLSGPQPAAPAPVEPPVVVRQQEEIAREFAKPAAVEDVQKAVKARAPKKDAKGVARRPESRKAAFTLRLDADRHLRLRLACAVQNRSAQMLVTEALDRLLADLPDVARLAASLPHQD